MRLRVNHGDIVAAVRVLIGHPHDKRREVFAYLRTQAQTALNFVEDNGMVHPEFGDGSLQSAAQRYLLLPERHLDDPDYAHCMFIVFGVLAGKL